ncbi:MAG: group III truncated hemoglobin [Alphaproteobacteria bacterium]|nr:group III truncated hemoglobin [Alphaproteobacteria bacterium]
MEPDIPPIEDGAERAKLEVAIDACVRRFYAKGVEDSLLGPIFTAVHDLEQHMGVVANFWSRSLLGTERYQGQPFAAHINLPIEPEHFTRWLELFSETASEVLPKPQAEQAIAKAAHMTQCFQAGLFPFIGADGKPSRVPAQ